MEKIINTFEIKTTDEGYQILIDGEEIQNIVSLTLTLSSHDFIARLEVTNIACDEDGWPIVVNNECLAKENTHYLMTPELLEKIELHYSTNNKN